MEKPFCSIDDVPSIGGVPDVAVRWLVEGVVPLNSFVGISGEPGAGKTWLGIALGDAVAGGKDFCGRGVEQRPVLYLDRENPAAVVRARCAYLGITDTPNFHYWGLWASEEPASLVDRRVIQFAAAGGVVIVDSMIRFHQAEENSAQEMAVVSGWVRALVRAGGTVVAMQHKSDKSERPYRGSSEALAGCDVLYVLTKGNDGRTLDLQCLKNRFAEEVGLGIQRRPGGFVSVDAAKQGEARTAQQVVADVLRRFKSGLPKTRLIELAAAEGGLTRKHAEAALVGGPWKVESGPNNAQVFSFPETPDAVV